MCILNRSALGQLNWSMTSDSQSENKPAQRSPNEPRRKSNRR